jgi:hypothetical protein
MITTWDEKQENKKMMYTLQIFYHLIKRSYMFVPLLFTTKYYRHIAFITIITIRLFHWFLEVKNMHHTIADVIS